jgi:hypothetical protein
VLLCKNIEAIGGFLVAFIISLTDAFSVFLNFAEMALYAMFASEDCFFPSVLKCRCDLLLEVLKLLDPV